MVGGESVRQNMGVVNLGWCDVCLCVQSASNSREFYADLGFWRVEGADEDGWAVVTNGELRLGLFEPAFMDNEGLSLNFRGGDVAANVAELRSKGYEFESERRHSASLRDPDGHLIFLDSAPGETKKIDPI